MKDFFQIATIIAGITIFISFFELLTLEESESQVQGLEEAVFLVLAIILFIIFGLLYLLLNEGDSGSKPKKELHQSQNTGQNLTFKPMTLKEKLSIYLILFILTFLTFVLI